MAVSEEEIDNEILSSIQNNFGKGVRDIIYEN